jgi:hypothetical protein
LDHRRWLLGAGPAAALLMIVVVTVDGATRAGYDPWRNWVSQLALGPRGWLGVVTMSGCGVLLVAYAIGLRLCLSPGRTTRWLVRLVLLCALGFGFLAAVPIDPGLGFPPGVPAVHTPRGFVHQAGAIALFAGGTGASVLFGRCLRTSAGWWVAAVMAVAFAGACLLVTLDVLGVLARTPSGLLERVALFAGLGWIGAAGLRVCRSG